MSSYRTLFEIGKSLVAETDITKLLPLAMDKVITEVNAQRGMIMVVGDDGKLLFETARNFNQQDITQPEFEISRTVISSVLESGQHRIIKNALEEPELKVSSSIGRLRILSVACAPMRIGDQTFGAIYVDNRDLSAIFDEGTGRLLSEFADLIAVAVRNALERRMLVEQRQSLKHELAEIKGYGQLIGRSKAMQEVLALIQKAAVTDTTVLIHGETGTGKELVARELFRQSKRCHAEFVALNCAALPEQLLESELFGHEKGAFTGASRTNKGWFETAHGGTIFFDEIGEMSPALQAKLLRVIQSGEFTPVGSRQTRKADVRIIAATHRNLEEMVKAETFREDLFYRLNIIGIRVPPLRERHEDVSVLADYFLGRYAKQFHKNVSEFTEEAIAALKCYNFPGNVRELENIVQRAVALAETDTIAIDDLTLPVSSEQGAAGMLNNDKGFNQAKQELIEGFERDYLTARLQETRANISEAARRSGMHKKNFIQKMKQYGIDRSDFLS